ncbi:type II CAAX endopeptidase family protein [Sphingopyxis sp.]|jgi:membrane protease YdiL (CAAX protease family)|uniref:type II CAAX endopeptidase family protein n=1 Tax=Sphingopyxis sp. TaxID=1908224 RepID=UPI002DFD5DB4|nr:type II CAAX endopeptidase family protein [Sphingopyxis sp.]
MAMHAEQDFPWYDDRPVALAWADWIIVLAALAIGFVFLVSPLLPAIVGQRWAPVLAPLLFVAVPLGALVWRAGPSWRRISNGFRWSYVGWGVAIGVLNILVTIAIGLIAIKTMPLSHNAVVEGLSGGAAPGALVQFYMLSAVQLFGEELFTILPFLFLLWLGTKHLGLSRHHAVLLGWIGSALLFGAIHLPTYGWNIAQAVLLIGTVRLVLMLAYLRTKSIWASTIAHIVNDWWAFTLAILAGGTA